jgi:hypothetical protein
MEASLTKLVRKLERYLGHPATDVGNPDTVPANGVFTRNDLETAMADHVYRADRYGLDYTLATSGSGAIAVHSPATDWEDGVVLRRSDGTAVVPDLARPLEGRWEFNAATQYPLYAYGRSYDLHASAADLLEQWAAKVKLEHDLSIGDLKLTRAQKYDHLVAMAGQHRRKIRMMGVQIVSDDVLNNSYDYRRATRPPPM